MRSITEPPAPPQAHRADPAHPPLPRERERPPQALFLTRAYARLLRPGLAELAPEIGLPGSRLRRQFDALDAAIDGYLKEVRLAA